MSLARLADHADREPGGDSPTRTCSQSRVPAPVGIKPLADRVLQELSPIFSRMYAKGGRPSVPPVHLLKAKLADRASTPVRSERQFCERLTYDMLFRWFLDLNIRGGPFDQLDVRQEPEPATGA